jgi:steroid 5-alpha reductase family enzyme
MDSKGENSELLYFRSQPRRQARLSRNPGRLHLAVWVSFRVCGRCRTRSIRKDPLNRGNILKTGLWRYTRHPNYFGEVVQWWGIWLLAVSVWGGAFGIAGPLTITVLILKVSGVPMLENEDGRES